MATKLKAHSFADSGGVKKYPDEWLNGEIWKLKEGVDYTNLLVCRQCLMQRAQRRGLICHTSVKERGFLIVQASPRT